MTKITETHLAEIRFHPAVIVLPCLCAVIFSTDSWQFGLSSENMRVAKVIGIVFSAIGFLTLNFAYGSMLRFVTTIDPSQHSNRLVTSGIYAFSRNPIYVGWFLFMLGLGIANMSVLIITITLFMIACLYWAVILKEEDYLERRFGDEYLQYKRSVRRWI